uniref:tRNA-splicing endonuclease subunit Sen15 domain-containing protein n=1 Tax=Anopheles funestus TaxID=62324 RepID=A0A182RHS7_ANOFN
MDNFHEILKTFYSFDCKDEALCYAACRVYSFLREEKRMIDVRYQFKNELQLFYLIAKKELEAAFNLFIPSVTTGQLNLVQLKYYRDTLKLPDGRKPEYIILAVCDPSSTVLLYRMTLGLKEIRQKLPSKGKLLRLKAESGYDKGSH